MFFYQRLLFHGDFNDFHTVWKKRRETLSSGQAARLGAKGGVIGGGWDVGMKIKARPPRIDKPPMVLNTPENTNRSQFAPLAPR